MKHSAAVSPLVDPASLCQKRLVSPCRVTWAAGQRGFGGETILNEHRVIVKSEFPSPMQSWTWKIPSGGGKGGFPAIGSGIRNLLSLLLPTSAGEERGNLQCQLR
ncbi:unnamed protein product [Boreogadus saida]